MAIDAPTRQVFGDNNAFPGLQIPVLLNHKTVNCSRGWSTGNLIALVELGEGLNMFVST